MSFGRINFYNICKDIIGCFVLACGFEFLLVFYSYDALPTVSKLKEINAELFLIMVFIKTTYKVFVNRSGWVYDKSTTVSEFSLGKATQEEIIADRKAKQIAKQNKKITVVHEAGHAVMSYLLEIESFHVLISYVSPKVITVCKHGYAKDIRKNILIKYAGAAAEEILFDQFTAGCMGNKNGDFETAVYFIKEYILMTDSSISKSMLDEEIADKVIALSKEFYSLSKKILLDNKEMLEVLSEYLTVKDSVSEQEIKKLFEDKQLVPKTE